MIKLPYGISNYESIVEDGYLYVDKTRYIEKLEELSDKSIMYLRPRKFGKTLFTSVIEHYYDIKEKEKFNKLFGNTYIGKNPTKLKNSYYILRFNFSGIDTENVESTIRGFRNKTATAMQSFANKYNLEINIDDEKDAEINLDKVLKKVNEIGEKVYVIIDEYDHFANELLGFDTSSFKDLISKNGKVRKFYEILKEGTETVVDRIFITGVAPITLDSLTSGFNIGADISQDVRFNEMMGFTQEEVKWIMNKEEINEKEQNELMPIIKENYDGYMFSKNAKEKIYNSNMTLYFFKEYIRFKRIPEKLIDVNIASDYSKLEKMINLYKGEEKEEIIQKTVIGEGVVSQITQKFNPAMEFTKEDFISILYYLGYLTIKENSILKPELVIPNTTMKELYSDYFLKMVSQKAELEIGESKKNEALTELALNGKIDKTIDILGMYMKNLSNRDYIKFDEKYIKLIFYCLAMDMGIYRVKSEMEIEGEYPDILLIPKQNKDKLYEIMIEFKYIKKEEYEKQGEKILKEKQKEAETQIKRYSEKEEFKREKLLRKYTIVAVKEKLFVKEII